MSPNTPRQRVTIKRVFAAAMGVVAALRGYGYIAPSTIPDGLSTLANLTGGLFVWGWVWLAVGVIAVAGIFRHSQSAPLVPFVAVNVLWGGSYLAEWFRRLEWALPEHWWNWWRLWDWTVISTSREWITSISYLGLAIATLTVIRLVDPAEVRSRTREGDR